MRELKIRELERKIAEMQKQKKKKNKVVKYYEEMNTNFELFIQDLSFDSINTHAANDNPLIQKLV